MNRSLPSLITGAVLVLALGGYMVIYAVDDYEFAVVRTWGKIAPPDPETGVSPDVKTEPGWYFRWPWPIQQVDVRDARLQITRLTGEEVGTRDAKNVIISTSVSWSVADPYTFARNCRDLDDAADRLRTIVRDQLKAVLGGYEFSQLVSTNPAELRHDEINELILSRSRAMARDLYGLELKSAGFETLTLPTAISETVFEAMRKERQAQAARYTSEGESQAAIIRATAENIAGTILAFADRKASEIIAEGRRRAAEYNRILAQDEDLAIFLLEIETLPRMLEKRSTLVLRADSAPYYLIEGSERPQIVEDRPTTRPVGEEPRAAASTLVAPPEMIRAD